MSDQRPITKAQLLKETDQRWSELNAALDRLTDDQMTNIRDAEGWAVKDHLTHIAAWERSMVYLFQGKSRHEGLGVDEKLFLQDDEAINAVIQRQNKDLTAAEARAQMTDVHNQLLALLEPMTDEDLMKPYSYYAPNATSEAESPVFFRVHGNAAGHFEEHLGWIKNLVGKSSP
jgi:hypothetical protein